MGETTGSSSADLLKLLTLDGALNPEVEAEAEAEYRTGESSEENSPAAEDPEFYEFLNVRVVPVVLFSSARTAHPPRPR